MKIMKIVGGAALAVAMFAVPTQAQQQFGIQASWANDFDLGIGARAEFGLPAFSSTGPLSAPMFAASFDYFFPDCDECSYFEFNGNVTVPVATGPLNPYAGAGLNMARVSVDTGAGDVSETELGLNILGGLRFPLGSLSTFAEARYEVGGGEQLVLTFGVLLGRN